MRGRLPVKAHILRQLIIILKSWKRLWLDLKAEGRHAEAFPADVRDSAAIDEITARIEREMGPIDILVNVAGVLRPGLIHSLSDEEWEATFSVNSTGVFNASRSVSKYMMDRRSGSIVTVGSNLAGVPRTSMAAYASSKARL